MAEDKFNASLLPNAVRPNGKLTIRFDSSGKFKDAQGVTLLVFEANDQDALEAPGRGTPMITFTGVLKGNKFTPDGPPKVPTVRDAVDKIEITADGTSFHAVTLPGASKENGVYELKLLITIPALSVKFTTDAVLVRAFKHFARNERAVITFLTGAESDSFFLHAKNFWQRNADIVVDRKGISLVEILEILQSVGKKTGPWGQINIVAHGNPIQILMKLFADSPPAIHSHLIKRELDKHSAPPKPDSIDGQSEVFFRSCNAGKDAELVDNLRKEFFPTAKFLKIPLWLQIYQTRSAGGAIVAVNEFFQEEIVVDGPTPEAAKAAEARFLDQVEELKGVSPGLPSEANARDELPSFAERKVTTSKIVVTGLLSEGDVTESDLKPKKDVDLASEFEDKWELDGAPLDSSSSTGRTGPERWNTKVVTKAVVKQSSAKTDAERNAIATLEALWSECTSATPKFLNQRGVFAFGSGSDASQRVPKLAKLHAQVEFVPADSGVSATINVEHLDDDDTFTVVTVAGKPLVLRRSPDPAAPDAAVTTEATAVPLPTQLVMNGVVVKLRLSQVFKVEYELTRTFVHRRRNMKIFEQGVPYEGRSSLVKPDPEDSSHYATSKP